MQIEQEPLYVRLNKIWREELDKNSYAAYGMSYEEHEEQKRKEITSNPDYVPCYKENGFETMEEYLQSKPSQEWDENVIGSENLIYANTMRQETNYYRNNPDYWEGKEKGYDY